jgi:hypothetical protein
VNVSCGVVDCGTINVTLDPSTNWWNQTWDKFKASTLGVNNDDLLARRDLLTGEKIENKFGYSNLFNPFSVSETKHSQLLDELDRIGFIAKEPKSFIRSYKMTNKEYDRLVQLYTQEVKVDGMNLNEYLTNFINSDEYDELIDGTPVGFDEPTTQKLPTKLSMLILYLINS